MKFSQLLREREYCMVPCALLNDSSVKCWGYGASGMLGYPAGVYGDGPGEMGDNLPTVDLGS